MMRNLAILFVLLLQIFAKESEVKIIMVGDVLIHSGLYKSAQAENGTYNFDFMFENVRDEIRSADLAIANQETIFVKNRDDYSGYPMFGSPVEVGVAEARAGFDIIAHATNHTIDKGETGIKDTLEFWKNYPNIAVLGIHGSSNARDLHYKVVNDIVISLVNYTYGLNGLESRRKGKEYLVDLLSDSDINATLHHAQKTSEIVIAILHIGEEYSTKPNKHTQETIDMFIDNGADIVFCAHPHVLQAYEVRTTPNGGVGVVYYSVGNFISAQDEIDRVLGGMAKVVIKKAYNGEISISEHELIPLVTHQENGRYTTYKLDDYSDELANKHRLKAKGLSLKKLNEIYEKIKK